MNAMPAFVLTSEPVSSALTRLDVSDLENVKDARHRLRACRTEAEYAQWAGTWGENLCNRAEDMAGEDVATASDLAAAEADAERAEKDATRMHDAIELAVKKLDAICDQHDVGPKTSDAICDVSSALENALTE